MVSSVELSKIVRVLLAVRSAQMHSGAVIEAIVLARGAVNTAGVKARMLIRINRSNMPFFYNSRINM